MAVNGIHPELDRTALLETPTLIVPERPAPKVDLSEHIREPPAALHDAAGRLRLGVGARLRQYRLLRELGHGGQGRVMLARDDQLGRLVALKTIVESHALSAEALQRFQNEARAVARVLHPNIVQLYEVFEVESVPFLAMEFVEGKTLLETVARHELSRRQIVDVLAQCCEAMGHAHKQGMIHRDLKPHNIMLTRGGVPKIMDFGLARSFSAEGVMDGSTLDGQVLGSPAYMAPEQARGQRRLIGPHTDVYALGTTMYQCLTCQLPHKADTPAATMLRIIQDEAVPLSSADPTIDPDLSAICAKAMEKNPAERYPDASFMAADLRRHLAAEPVLARPAGILTRLHKGIRRNKDMAFLTGAALTCMALVLSGAVTLFARQTTRAALEALRAELKSVANTAAMVFPPMDLAQVQSSDDMKKELFRDLVLRLNELRRRNPQIEQAAILRPAGDGRGWRYIADADAFLAEGAERAPGAAFAAPPRSVIAPTLRAAAAEEQPVRTRWGSVLPAYAPVLGDQGEPVAIVAVEVNADRIHAQSQPGLRTASQVGGLAGVLFLGFTGFAGVQILRRKRRLGTPV